MNINSPKFKSKLIRVFALTFLWCAVSVYLNVIQDVSVIMVTGNTSFISAFKWALLINTAEVFVAGFVIATFEVFYFTDRFRNKSFGYAVLMKSLFYAGALVFLMIVISFAETFITNSFTDFFTNTIPIISLNFFIWAPVFLVSIFLIQVSDKFGLGVLLKFILGKYHTPKEETRIFMFLDMKSSTSIAEALGNVKYFELLNDFFYDVTDAIIETKGEIYQYVGDEVIISWKLENGIQNSNSLNCFFDIHKVLKKYSEKYETKYGLVPSFKAGIHYGEVTVGEVGVLKRDITFSGDVLNTTARIQELCNKYNEKFIASKTFLDLLDQKKDFVLKEIGIMNLRGRSEPIELYSVKANL